MHTNFLEKFYPEIGAGQFSSVDGSIEFYGRINALLDKESVILDFGAGRGAWFEDDVSDFRKQIRLLKGKASKIIGCDVDSAVLGNRALDEAFVFAPGEALPFQDESIDMIVSDFVFEHISEPLDIATEFRRILRPGGWICARTPTKYCYVAIAARMVKNSKHSKVISRAQPTRKEVDVFPTVYKLNTMSEVRKYFTDDQYNNFSYTYTAEPAYHFNSSAIFRVLEFTQWLMPRFFSGNLFVFLQKK